MGVSTAKEGNMIQRGKNQVPNNHWKHWDWLQGCRCNMYNLLTQDLETKKVLLPWRLIWCMLKIETTQVAMFFFVPDFHFCNFQVVMIFSLQFLTSIGYVCISFSWSFPSLYFFKTLQGQTCPTFLVQGKMHSGSEKNGGIHGKPQELPKGWRWWWMNGNGGVFRISKWY